MLVRALAPLLLLVACAPPEPVLGGGVRGSFSGRAHVVVLDRADLRAIEGARVLVDGEEVGTTDGGGRLDVSRGTVDRVEARAAGYRDLAFVGAEASVYTFLLDGDSTASPVTVRGGIAAFEDLEPPPGGVVRARVGVAVDRSLPDVPGPAATCESPGPCTFEIEIPPGPTHLYAQIDAVHPGPTAAPEDDVIMPLSFGLSEQLRPDPGEVYEGVRIDRFADAALQEVRTSAPSAPPELDDVAGVPAVALSRSVLPFFADPGREAHLLPRPSGGLAQASYWAVSIARGAAGTSVTVRRELPGIAPESLEPPAHAALPSATLDGEVYRVAGVDGASLTEIRVDGGARVVVFDGRAEIAAPAGPATLVTWDAPEQADGWDLSEVERTFTRRATVPVP